MKKIIALSLFCMMGSVFASDMSDEQVYKLLGRMHAFNQYHKHDSIDCCLPANLDEEVDHTGFQKSMCVVSGIGSCCFGMTCFALVDDKKSMSENLLLIRGGFTGVMGSALSCIKYQQVSEEKKKN